MVNSLVDVSHWKTRIAVGRMAFDAGLYSQAARHFRMALAIIQKDNSTPELLSINLICLAKALSCLNEYSEAEKLVNQALQIDTANQDNLLQLARDYLELASICWKQRRLELSEKYAHKVLELFNTLVKKDRIVHAQSIARAYKLLAIIKDENQAYDEGLKLIEQALSILGEMPQGTRSEAYGEALMAKVMLLIDKGEMEQVEPMIEDAVQLVELHKGQFHPQLAQVMSILVDHMKKSGRQSPGKNLLDKYSKNKS